MDSTARDRETQYRNMIEFLGADNAGLYVRSNTLKASRMRSIVNSYYFRETFKENARVAYTGELCPNEVLSAFNIVALNLEAMAALFSQADSLHHHLKLSDAYHVSRDICSNVRGSLGVALGNCSPTPNLVVGNSYPCDGITKLTYMMSQLYNCPFFLLDTPNTVNEDTVAYVVEQLKVLINGIENALSIQFSPDALVEVVNNANKAREYYCKTVQLCQKATLSDVPRELVEIVVSNLWGTKELVNVCKTLYEEALAKSQKPESKRIKRRVMWVGQLPFYSNELVTYLEQECGLEVVYLSAINHSEFMLDPRDPLKSIAVKLMIHNWDPFALRQATLDAAQSLGVAGVILLNVWGCRNMLGINHLLRDATLKNKLKFLTIDGDYLDREKYSFSQLKNRIDAFVEIIKGG